MIRGKKKYMPLLVAATLLLAACTTEKGPCPIPPSSGEEEPWGVPIAVRMAAASPATQAATDDDEARVWFYSWFQRGYEFKDYTEQPNWTASVRLSGLTAEKKAVEFVEGPQYFPSLVAATRYYFALHPKPTSYVYPSPTEYAPPHFTIENPDGKADPMGTPSAHSLGFNSSYATYEHIDCTLHHLCSKLTFTVRAGTDPQYGSPATDIKVTGIEVRNVVLPAGIAAIPGYGMCVYPLYSVCCHLKEGTDYQSASLPDIPSGGVTVGSQPTAVGTYLIVAPCIMGEPPNSTIGHRGNAIQIVVKTDKGDYAPATVTLDNTKVAEATRTAMEQYYWYGVRKSDADNVNSAYDPEKDLIPGVAYEIAIDLYGKDISTSARVVDWEQAGQGTVVIPE